MVFLAYLGAAALAFLLLYFFHAHWYWHVISVIAGLSIGFVPPHLIPVPMAWGVTRDITIGCVFIFLMVWGLCAPLFHHHQRPHATPQA